MGIAKVIEHALKPLRRRVLLMVGRAVLNLVNDTLKLQALQVTALNEEVIDDAERFQQYGFTSHPHAGAECVVLSVGGIRQHPIIIAVEDRRYRVVGLETGEVCLYTDEDLTADEDNGPNPHRITLLRGREIRMECGESFISMTPTEILIQAGDGTGHVGIND